VKRTQYSDTTIYKSCAFWVAGVWQYDNATAEQAILLAFEAGFTNIDTAQMYQNQVGTGKAVGPFCICAFLPTRFKSSFVRAAAFVPSSKKFKRFNCHFCQTTSPNGDLPLSAFVHCRSLS
jgi:hypothetical protein